jgi:hypothetical protein
MVVVLQVQSQPQMQHLYLKMMQEWDLCILQDLLLLVLAMDQNHLHLLHLQL